MQIAYITYENVGKYTSYVEDEDHILLSFLKLKECREPSITQKSIIELKPPKNYLCEECPSQKKNMLTSLKLKPNV